jgi:hypothetical protein
MCVQAEPSLASGACCYTLDREMAGQTYESEAVNSATVDAAAGGRHLCNQPRAAITRKAVAWVERQRNPGAALSIGQSVPDFTDAQSGLHLLLACMQLKPHRLPVVGHSAIIVADDAPGVTPVVVGVEV